MPEKIDLKYAIGLPPEKAIEYFKKKGYKISWDWWDTWQESHAKAFSVAKAMRMDILMDIREMIEKALKEGLTLQQFRKELEPRLKAKGWWGKVMVGDEEGARQVQLGSPWRLKTIYRTNMQTAFMAGRYKEMMENVDNRPYWQYVAVMDSRTRPAHAALNGRIFRYDDPFWKTHYPPLGFNCYDEETEVYTNQGWKKFSELSGDELFLSLNPENFTIEYVKATDYIAYPYKGLMYHFKSHNFDLKVTPDHNMVVIKNYDLKQRRHKLRFVKPNQLADSDCIPRAVVNWEGYDDENIVIEGLIFKTEIFARFIGFYLAEGSVSINNEGRYIIKIAQSNEINKEKIIKNLDPFPLKLWIGKDAIYVKPQKQFAKWLKNLGKAQEKFIPDEIKMLSSDFLRQFLNAYLLGDGHIILSKKERYCPTIIKQYFTSSKKLADDLTEIIIKAGAFPSYGFRETEGKQNIFSNGKYEIKTNIWEIRETNSVGFHFHKKHLKVEDYNGYVYGVTLEKNHILLVRRKYKVSWCGNCRCRVRALSQGDIDREKLPRPPDSEDTAKRITWKDALVSKRTGELRPVAVYKDPLTGKEIATDVGWSYNPAEAFWFPNLDRYPYDVAKGWIMGGLTGPDFRAFFEGKLKGNFPVAVLEEDYMKAIKSKSQVVYLSDETLAKNKKNHPEIPIQLYMQLPDIITRAQLIVQDKDNTFVFLKIGQKVYYGSIKTTLSGKANFLTSLRLARESDIEKIKKKGKILKDEL